MLSTGKFLGLLSALLFFSRAEAESPSLEKEKTSSGNLYTLEVRANPFFPTGKRMRKVYGYVWPNYGIEASRKFNSSLTGWTNIDYTNSHGHVHVCHLSSKIRILNGSFGLKLTTHKFSNLQVYLGIGPTLGGVWIHNESSCGNHHDSKFILGGVLKFGFRVNLFSHWILNFFGDYSYVPAWFNNTANIGGAKAGLGLGYNF